MDNSEKEFLVAGAGVAGLSAARALAEAGMRVTVVEARDRVGGRILSERHGKEVVELGAQFIHGKPPELWDLIHEAGLETFELDGAQLCWQDDRLAARENAMDQDFHWIEALKGRQKPDCTFAAYLDQERVPEPARSRLIRYVEGFNAADHTVISVASLGQQQAAEDAIDGDRMFQVRGGYDQLANYLADKVCAAGGTILLNTQVVAIQWRQGRVQIECRQAGGPVTLSAPKAIIALPLGVLQNGAVRFEPDPEPVMKAAFAMRMGEVQRVVMLFRERFWSALAEARRLPELQELSFLFAFAKNPPVWWTQHPELSPMLTAWVGGPLAKQPRPVESEEKWFHLLRELGTIFGIELAEMRERFVEAVTHDWSADPYARGAYSYVGVGAIDASERMAKPVEETLYFAGEHTDTTGHWGTVHGALRSGLRAAAQVLQSL